MKAICLVSMHSMHTQAELGRGLPVNRSGGNSSIDDGMTGHCGSESMSAIEPLRS